MQQRKRKRKLQLLEDELNEQSRCFDFVKGLYVSLSEVSTVLVSVAIGLEAPETKQAHARLEAIINRHDRPFFGYVNNRMRNIRGDERSHLENRRGSRRTRTTPAAVTAREKLDGLIVRSNYIANLFELSEVKVARSMADLILDEMQTRNNEIVIAAVKIAVLLKQVKQLEIVEKEAASRLIDGTNQVAADVLKSPIGDSLSLTVHDVVEQIFGYVSEHTRYVASSRNRVQQIQEEIAHLESQRQKNRLEITEIYSELFRVGLKIHKLRRLLEPSSKVDLSIVSKLFDCQLAKRYIARKRVTAEP